MKEIEVFTWDGDRERGAFSNPVINWHYKLKIGRLELLSIKKYNTPMSAINAGLRAREILLKKKEVL